MSYTEICIGKLRKIDSPDNVTTPILEVNGNLYTYEERISKESDGWIQELIPNKDGDYTYIMEFYNGGTCLEEMLEESIKEIINHK